MASGVRLWEWRCGWDSEDEACPAFAMIRAIRHHAEAVAIAAMDRNKCPARRKNISRTTLHPPSLFYGLGSIDDNRTSHRMVQKPNACEADNHRRYYPTAFSTSQAPSCSVVLYFDRCHQDRTVKIKIAPIIATASSSNKHTISGAPGGVHLCVPHAAIYYTIHLQQYI